MQVTITGQHLEITDALRDYVNEKMDRVQRHFDHVTKTQVVLHVEKTRHIAEGNLSAKGTMINANGEAEDMYAAIDQMIDKLDRQVRRYKTKIRDHHQNGGALKQQEIIDSAASA